MVEAHSSNFREITTNVLGVRIFRKFTVSHRRRRGDMIQKFTIIKDIEDIPSERFLKLCNSSSTRGHSLKLEKKKINKIKQL